MKGGIVYDFFDHQSREDFGARREKENMNEADGILLCFSPDVPGALDEIKMIARVLETDPVIQRPYLSPVVRLFQPRFNLPM